MSILTVEAADVETPGVETPYVENCCATGPVRGVRVPVAARVPVARDRRGPARPPVVPATARRRGVAVCAAPVVRPRAVHGDLLRRIAAGVGMVVASAAAVVGLGLLADASAVGAAPAPSVPVTAAP